VKHEPETVAHVPGDIPQDPDIGLLPRQLAHICVQL
jgi:hypothetical protein